MLHRFFIFYFFILNNCILVLVYLLCSDFFFQSVLGQLLQVMMQHGQPVDLLKQSYRGKYADISQVPWNSFCKEQRGGKCDSIRYPQLVVASPELGSIRATFFQSVRKVSLAFHPPAAGVICPDCTSSVTVHALTLHRML